jgi:hypothetical protein
MDQYTFMCTKYQGILSKGQHKLLMKRDPLSGMWFLKGQCTVVESVLMVTDKPDNGSNKKIRKLDIHITHDRFGRVNEQSF